MRKKTEDKSVIYKSLWFMGTVMILAVLIIELVSIFLIQRDRRKTERLFSNTIESYGQFWEDKFASTSKALLLMSGTDSTPYYQQLCISKDPLTVETAKVQQQKIMIEMGERYGREMMLFVYVPERNIYFVAQGKGQLMPIRERLKRKSFLISRTNIRNQRKTGFLWNLMDISTWRVFIRLKMDTLELHFLWKELYLVLSENEKIFA